jgi:hypothetical protein
MGRCGVVAWRVFPSGVEWSVMEVEVEVKWSGVRVGVRVRVGLRVETSGVEWSGVDWNRMERSD